MDVAVDNALSKLEGAGSLFRDPGALPTSLLPLTTPERVDMLERRTRDLEWTLYTIVGLFVLVVLMRGLRQ